MAYQSTVPQYTLSMPAGSVQELACTFIDNGPAVVTPWPITGFTWEYVVRESAAPGAALVFEITTTVSVSGLITITDTASVSQALLSVYPAATSSLTPGTYFHALWSNPGLDSAYSWFSGALLVNGNPQP